MQSKLYHGKSESCPVVHMQPDWSGVKLLNTLRNLQGAYEGGLVSFWEFTAWKASLTSEQRIALADEIWAANERIAAL